MFTNEASLERRYFRQEARLLGNSMSRVDPPMAARFSLYRPTSCDGRPERNPVWPGASDASGGVRVGVTSSADSSGFHARDSGTNSKRSVGAPSPEEMGTRLLVGPLWAMASFDAPRGHSLCQGTALRFWASSRTLDALPRIFFVPDCRRAGDVDAESAPTPRRSTPDVSVDVPGCSPPAASTSPAPSPRFGARGSRAPGSA